MSRAKSIAWWEVLHVSASATEAEIREAHRALIWRWHPDRNKSKNAASKTAEINAARDVGLNALRNPPPAADSSPPVNPVSQPGPFDPRFDQHFSRGGFSRGPPYGGPQRRQYAEDWVDTEIRYQWSPSRPNGENTRGYSVRINGKEIRTTDFPKDDDE